MNPFKERKTKRGKTTRLFAYTGIFLMFDNRSVLSIFDLPARLFDGRQGHILAYRLTQAHTKFVNDPTEDKYVRWTVKQLPSFAPYQLSTKHFNVINADHLYIFCGVR